MNEPNRDDRLGDADIALLAEALSPCEPRPGRAEALKARVMAAVHAKPESENARAAAPVVPPSIDGTVLDQFVTVRAQDRPWHRVAPGVEMCTLVEDAERRSILIRMRPGSVLPSHHHEMAEESLLLEGDAWIGNDLYLTAGDYHYSPAGASHPVLRSPAGCIVFIRGEREFHPRITGGLVWRLLQSLGSGLMGGDRTRR